MSNTQQNIESAYEYAMLEASENGELLDHIQQNRDKAYEHAILGEKHRELCEAEIFKCFTSKYKAHCYSAYINNIVLYDVPIQIKTDICGDRLIIAISNDEFGPIIDDCVDEYRYDSRGYDYKTVAKYLMSSYVKFTLAYCRRVRDMWEWIRKVPVGSHSSLKICVNEWNHTVYFVDQGQDYERTVRSLRNLGFIKGDKPRDVSAFVESQCPGAITLDYIQACSVLICNQDAWKHAKEQFFKRAPRKKLPINISLYGGVNGILLAQKTINTGYHSGYS